MTGEKHEASPGPNTQDEGTRRLLYAVLGILSIAAVALLVLLVTLLWPKSSPTTTQAAGYPVIPVRSILGFGEDTNLVTPLGVAFDPQGNVWIADTGNSRVLVSDQQGQLLRKIGEAPTDPGNVVSPYGIAFDAASNRAYVADFAQRLIKVYDISSGSYITTFPNAKQKPDVFGKNLPFTPFDVAFVEGRLVATSPNGLWFFDRDGFVIGHWGSKAPGTGTGQYNFPDAIAVDQASGQIIVADSLNKRVVALDTSGAIQWVSGSGDVSGQATGYWQLPRGVAIGPGCNIYVVDTFRPSGPGVGDGFFQVLSPDGRLLSGFGADGDGEGQFNFPDHLSYWAQGDLWAIADREHQRVLLFKLGPLPPPDQNTSERYPKSFVTGPFQPIASPAGLLPSPSASPGTCPGPSAPPSDFPWWILVVALLVLVLVWRAVKRIREDRRNRLLGEGETPTEGASSEGAADLSAGYDSASEETLSEGTPTVEEPEQGS